MYETTLPIREDLAEAHGAVVDRWAQPDTWWTAAERLAIVEEVRRARDTENPPPPWIGASGGDAVAVSANFHMMTRIADGTGTPLDHAGMERTADVRAKIGVNDYASRRQIASS